MAPTALSMVAVAAVAAVLCPAHAEDIGDGYVPPPNVEAQPGDPALMTGYSLVDAAKADNAVCLDGSPGLYYHRPGTGSGANKWYIHMEGGGWCSSVAACQGRSLTNLGSSTKYAATVSMNSGYFSLDPAQNPLMYNWNMVYFKYCDGGSFSGSNASSTPSGVGGTRLHWRGKHILNGGITDMLQKRRLVQAEDVVVSGCSAGGLAAFLHCDHFAERIHKEGSPSAKVACMPDSGLFRDYQGCTEPGLCRAPHYHDRLVWVFSFMNASSGVNDACVAAEHPASNCMFAEHTMKYLKTPTFPLQSEYDAWQVIADLGVIEVKQGTMPVTPAKVALVNEYGVNFTAVVRANLLNQPQHSIFLDSCFHHCGGWDAYRAGPKNVTSALAMKEWYEAIGDPALRAGGQPVWIQGKDYPCLECCG